jgi:hypothetical protein
MAKTLPTHDYSDAFVRQPLGIVRAVSKAAASCNRFTAIRVALENQRGCRVMACAVNEVRSTMRDDEAVAGRVYGSAGRQGVGGVDVVCREASSPRSIPLSARRANADPIADPTATDRTKMATTTRNMNMARFLQTSVRL